MAARKQISSYDEKQIFSDEADKHFMAKIISAMIFLLGAVMTVVCYLQGSKTLVYVSIGYGTAFLITFIQLHFSKDLNLFYHFAYAIFYGLEILYLFTGGQEGFGLIWIILMPVFTLYMVVKVRFYILINSISLLILITFFWTPLFQYCWDYTTTFRIRFPILFLIICSFGAAIKTRMRKNEKKKRLVFNELINLHDTLQQTINEQTLEIKKEKEHSDRVTLELAMALTAAIDAKDKYTSGHSVRVAKYSQEIARKMGKPKSYQEKIYLVGLLHDIGKIGVPDEIINKTARLTDEEFEIVKSHPQIGYDILKDITSMPEIQIGVHWHHERYDGKGYPDGLKEKEIPEFARIISVADTYDAMTSNRSYRKLLPQSVVREEFIKGRNTQFDPFIADKMIEMIDADTEYQMHG